MDEEEIKTILMVEGLKNAVEFGGTPNKKAVMGKLMAQRKELRSQAKIILPLLDQILKEIEIMDENAQKEKLLELDPHALEQEETGPEEKELPPLENLDKHDKVVMRMAPYPSGALHVGNARMIVLNNEYVKKYNGELILFFDDTIGSPKSLRDSPNAKYVLPEAYDLIQEGLKWLGIDYDKVYYKSDRLEIYYDYCKKLIKDRMAYVCFCKAGEFKEKYKNRKIDCPHRNQSMEENLNLWKQMLNGDYAETTAVVRLKTGMDQKDPALRDQIIMRISEADHPKVGTKYIIWPMLEFSWAIDDHLIGATHILRGSDLVKEDFIEDFIWKHFGWKKAEFLHYGRINFPDMKLSKTRARNKIQEGKYNGWDDPRTWSLQSLEKRGIRPEALYESLLDLGMSLSGITFSVNWLYSKNQSIIDEISDRYFYVENPIEMKIADVPSSNYTAEPLLLPSNEKKGVRKIDISANEGIFEVLICDKDASKLKSGDIVRLKDLFNVKIKEIDINNHHISTEFHSKELNREFSIIHWVPKHDNIPVRILKPDGSYSTGKGESNLQDIPLEKTIQFERYGFVNPIGREGKELFCYFTH